jgi:dynein light intermediate chain 1
LKHNVIDRDKIAVPPNWDSWGKIRVLGGSFDPEVISNGWAEDIQLELGSKPCNLETLEQNKAAASETPGALQEESAIAQYEEWCRDPNSGGLAVVESAMNDDVVVSVESDDTQSFLERQLKILEAYKAKAPDKAPENAISRATRRVDFGDEKSVHEHIGPVQFNMGGIQVDADDMLQRLKVRT